MEAKIERASDAERGMDLRITIRGGCDDASARATCVQVSNALQDGPTRNVVVDTTNLDFDANDGSHRRIVAGVLYIAARGAETFDLVDTDARKRLLRELVSSAK